jgi:hypothetical protein
MCLRNIYPKAFEPRKIKCRMPTDSGYYVINNYFKINDPEN